MKKTNTLTADILLKRGNRADVPVIREGELIYIKDEKRIAIGTNNTIEDVAMKRDLTATLDIANRTIKELEENLKERLEEKEFKNKKVIERLSNKDINDLRKISAMLENDYVLVKKSEIDTLLKGEDKK